MICSTFVRTQTWAADVVTDEGEEFTLKINNSYSYIIEDLQGKTVTNGNAEGETLICKYLDKGIYILKIISGNEVLTRKVIKI